MQKNTIQFSNDILTDKIINNPTFRKELARKSFYYFFHIYFPHFIKYPTADFQNEICNILQNSKNKFSEIIAFRGSAKSTFATFAFPIWSIISGNSKFVILLADTYSQAKLHIYNLKTELESNKLLNQDWGSFEGEQEWTATDIVLPKYDARITAKSRGQKVRGLRHRQYRPGLIICHKKGTRIFYKGKWIEIENYPNSKEIIDKGFEVKLCGLPFTETVSLEHFYWTKKIQGKTSSNSKIVKKTAKWIKAKDLDKNCFIGYPIDMTIKQPQKIDCYCPQIIKDKKSGKILKTKHCFKKIIPKEFYDKDFWWLIGLWWGDGHTAGKYQMGFTIADKDKDIFEKVKFVLSKYNKKFSIIRNEENGKYFQIVFSWVIFTRWLKTWRIGNSQKKPPYWVERLSIKYQKELIKGYLDADGWVDKKNQEVRLTSVYLNGLLSVKRILMRIGIPSTIRIGMKPQRIIIKGREVNCQRKYDLRFRQNANLLRYSIKNQTRYGYENVHIKNGYLWSKIRKIKKVENQIFIPIKTKSGTYTTYFGLSHNCDDIESLESVRVQEQRDKTYQWLLGDVIPAGDEKTEFILIGNLLHKDGIMNRIKEEITNDLRDGQVKEFPFFDEDNQPIWKERFRRAEDIRTEKRKYDNRTWQREFLLKIVPEEGQVIKDNWIQYYDEVPEPQFQGTGIDLAISKKTTADYTAMVSAKLNVKEDGFKIYIMPNPVNERFSLHETVEKAKQVSLALGSNSLTPLWVEDVAYQKAAVEEMQRTGLPAKSVKVSTDKRARLEMISSYVQNGSVVFPKKGCEDLIIQLTGFGAEAHDDLADAFVHCVQALVNQIANEPSLTIF